MLIWELWEHGTRLCVYGDVRYSKNRRSKIDFFSESGFLGNLVLWSQLEIFIVFVHNPLKRSIGLRVAHQGYQT